MGLSYWSGNSKSSETDTQTSPCNVESSSSDAASSSSSASTTPTAISVAAEAIVRASDEFDLQLERDLRAHRRFTSSLTASPRSTASSGTSTTTTTNASSSASSMATDQSEYAIAQFPRTRRARRALALNRESNSSSSSSNSSGDSNMLTLDEFLRETSQANASSNDAEHQLTLLLMHRRNDRDRPSSSSVPSAATDAGQSLWRRSLLERTGAARLTRAPLLQLNWVPSTESPRELPNLPTVTDGPATSTTATATAGDSPHTPTMAYSSVGEFETLVGHIRRSGNMEEFLNLPSLDNPATSLEVAMASNDNPRTTVRVQDARLQAMQARIDLLASEFAILRNTRREPRRTEAAAASAASSSSTSSTTARTPAVPSRPTTASSTTPTSGPTSDPRPDHSTPSRIPITTDLWTIRRGDVPPDNDISEPQDGSSSSSSSEPIPTRGTSYEEFRYIPPSARREAAVNRMRRLAEREREILAASRNATAYRRVPRPTVALPPTPPTAPPAPVSIDRRSCVVTSSERNRMLRDALFQMQIQKLP